MKTAWAALLLLAGCDGPSEPSRISPVADDDPKILAAMEKARATFDRFFELKKGPAATAVVKVRFEGGGDVEHMWVDEVRRAGTGFAGVLANTPGKIRGLKAGDPTSFTLDRVSDWMVLEGDLCRGGWTQQVIRARLTGAEARDFDRQFSYRYEEIFPPAGK
jgi:uncharacterized protein YegJ (DUF2314 family)